jgi:hypothetical protein
MAGRGQDLEGIRCNPLLTLSPNLDPNPLQEQIQLTTLTHTPVEREGARCSTPFSSSLSGGHPYVG